jgi:hypothetical protein
MRCIYCLEEKGPEDFHGREHVIPQAFGCVGTNNMVLKCVCDACNYEFGRTIDLKLARDSAEGLDRVNRGLKPASEYKSLGARSTSRVEFKEGPLAGGKGYHVPSQGDGIGVRAFPQVWFAKSEDGPWERFHRDEVPTKDELSARGYERGASVYLRTFEIDDPIAFLEAKGFRLNDAQLSAGANPTGRVYVENVTKIAEPEFRAVTKIGLNYLAYVLGSSVALLPAFNDARRFARYGGERRGVRIHPYENPWFTGRRGHYVSLSKREEMTIAQLSILMRIQYFVVLSSDQSVSVTATAHLFDLEADQVKEIEPLPITRGKPLGPSRT